MSLSAVPPALISAAATISSLPASQLSSGAALLGVASHWAYFIHGELDGQVWSIFLALVTLPPSLAAFLCLAAGTRLSQAIITTTVATTSYLLALGVSILVYRLWLHPTAKFPGPFMARVTKLYYPYAYKASGGQYYRTQAAWLATYGDIVRTGPNELICTRPEILPVLAKAAKGTWYNIGNNNSSLQLERNKATHSIRRRVWDRAFTPAAIVEYLPRIAHYRSGLLSALAGNTEKNITAWLSYYAFDVMGALTYGRDFGMLEKGGKDNSDYFLRMTHASMRSLGLLGHVPWVLLLLERLGAAGEDHMRFLAWCEETVEQRKKRGLGEGGKDLFEVLLEAEPNNKPPHYIPLQGDSRTAIVAGSDTTASTLIALFAYLAASPEALDRLQKELDTESPESMDSPFLNACIDEALRLNPAIPGGVPRTTPPEGMRLDDGTVLPGGVNILFPQWAAMRNPDWFEEPEKFRPERWLESSPEKLAQMRAVFHPFWLGRHSCAGKSLAMTQLRTVTAAIVRRFEFTLVGKLEEAFERCIDTFTIEMGEVWCTFKERA